MIEGHSRPVTTAHARRCSRCNRELIIISILQVAALNNICCRLDLHMYKGQRNTSVRASTNTAYHMLQGCQMRTKNNVHSNSIISNIYIMDEIFLLDFQIAHLTHSLAAASKCQYITSQISRNLGARNAVV